MVLPLSRRALSVRSALGTAVLLAGGAAALYGCESSPVITGSGEQPADPSAEDASTPTAEPTYGVLAVEYRTTSPHHVVTNDGKDLTAVGAKALAALKATTWALTVTSGNTSTVVNGAGVTIDGVAYASSLCSDLVSALGACKGDLSCWNGKSVVPAGAHALRCAAKGASGDVCDPLPEPSSGAVAILDEPGALSVWLQGKKVVEVSHSTTTTSRLFGVFGDAGSVMVTLDDQGVVTEVAQSGSAFDWRKQVDAARLAVRGHASPWTYSEASCPGTISHSTCDRETSSFLACADALLGGATRAQCFTTDTQLYELFKPTPFGFNLICK